MKIKLRFVSALLVHTLTLMCNRGVCGVTSAAKSITPLVLVHGGAAVVSDSKVAARMMGVKRAAHIGYEKLSSSGSVLDAVEEAVRSMEINPDFNAGLGAVLTWDGNVEMDAAIMNGANLNAGCVSLARDIYHPITLARHIMQNNRHTYLAGEGAMHFAVEQGFELLPEGALVTDAAVEALERFKRCYENPTLCDQDDNTWVGTPGTVGAVAIDAAGNVAAATSTGGLTGKMHGRIGDSPILGAGTYADNAAGAVSATGHGETIMRSVMASRLLNMVTQHGMSAQGAAVQVVDELTSRFNLTAGVIAIDRDGHVGIHFTTQQMAWAYQRGQELHFGLNHGEDFLENTANSSFSFY